MWAWLHLEPPLLKFIEITTGYTGLVDASDWFSARMSRTFQHFSSFHRCYEKFLHTIALATPYGEERCRVNGGGK